MYVNLLLTLTECFTANPGVIGLTVGSVLLGFNMGPNLPSNRSTKSLGRS